MNLAADIKKVLVDASIVTAETWFERFMPDEPPSVTVFYEYEGRPPLRHHDDFTAAVRPRFQIVTRGLPNEDDTAIARAKAIHDRLDGLLNQALESGARYISVESIGYFGFVKRDPLGRASFAGSYEAQVAH